MSNEINLPYFQHINTTLGLKYLNGNKKLYIKILNNFLNRYKNLKIETLNDEEFKDTIHTIKGLSSTLGMVSLSNLAKIIHKRTNREKMVEFSKSLALVIDELQTELKDEKRETILIVDDISEDIDILIDFLGDKHDIIVALNEADAIETITTEDISLVLLYTKISSKELNKILKQKFIHTIFMIDSLDSNMIKYSNYIQKPLDVYKLEKHIKTQI